MQKLVPGADGNGQKSVAGGKVEEFLPAAFEELRDRMWHWGRKRKRLKRRRSDKKRVHAQGRLAMGARHEQRRIGVAVFAGMRTPMVDALGDGRRNVDRLAAAHGAGGSIAKRGGDERTEGEIAYGVEITVDGAGDDNLVVVDCEEVRRRIAQTAETMSRVRIPNPKGFVPARRNYEGTIGGNGSRSNRRRMALEHS